MGRLLFDFTCFHPCFRDLADTTEPARLQQMKLSVQELLQTTHNLWKNVRSNSRTWGRCKPCNGTHTYWEHLRTNQTICLSKSKGFGYWGFSTGNPKLSSTPRSSASCQVLGKNLAWMGTMQAKRRTTAPPMWRLWISQAIQELMHIPKSTCWSNAVKNAGRPQQNP